MAKPTDLSGKHIMVTGASSGIGKGIAAHLSKMGANLIMVARNEDRLRETLKVLEPGDHSYRLLDLNNLDEIEGLFDDVCTQGGKLDGLVHSAGTSLTIPLQFLKMDDLKNIMSINFYSFIELVKQYSKKKNNNGGSIVAVSSISSRVGARGLAAYCASKGALESSVRALALDLAAKNIRINCVAPGVIDTRIYDDLKEIANNKDFVAKLKERQILGIGNPEDVACAAAFLLSETSRFITGTTLIVDGGYTAH